MLFAFCGMLPIILLIIESNLLKNEIFNMIVNIYCWILFISLIAWILFLMGIELPNFSTSWEGHYEYKNYFLFYIIKGMIIVYSQGLVAFFRTWTFGYDYFFYIMG